MTRTIAVAAAAVSSPRARATPPSSSSASRPRQVRSDAATRAAQRVIAVGASLALTYPPHAAHAHPGAKPVPVIDDPELG